MPASSVLVPPSQEKIASPITSPITICLLGSFLMLKLGHPVSLREGGKSQALISHLGLQIRDGISRDRLLQLLWPTSDATLAGQSLHSLVYSLNKTTSDVLGSQPLVIRADSGYRLNTDAGVVVDVERFDLLAKRGDQHSHIGNRAAAVLDYSYATELYRGDLCIDQDVYTLIERQRLRTRYLTLLAYLADSSYDAHNYDACLKYAWRLLTSDPCREDAHRLVMRCYVRQARRAEAMYQYRVCETVLLAEFNAAPESATTALFEQIRLHPDSVS